MDAESLGIFPRNCYFWLVQTVFGFIGFSPFGHLCKRAAKLTWTCSRRPWQKQWQVVQRRETVRWRNDSKWFETAQKGSGHSQMPGDVTNNIKKNIWRVCSQVLLLVTLVLGTGRAQSVWPKQHLHKMASSASEVASYPKFLYGNIVYTNGKMKRIYVPYGASFWTKAVSTSRTSHLFLHQAFQKNKSPRMPGWNLVSKEKESQPKKIPLHKSLPPQTWKTWAPWHFAICEARALGIANPLKELLSLTNAISKSQDPGKPSEEVTLRSVFFLLPCTLLNQSVENVSQFGLSKRNETATTSSIAADAAVLKENEMIRASNGYMGKMKKTRMT